MEAEPTVLIRQRCGECGGSGQQRRPGGTGHVSWTKRVDCASCAGSGLAERWIPLGELKRLLDDPVGPA